MAVAKENIRFLGEGSQQHLNQWTEMQLNHLQLGGWGHLGIYYRVGDLP